jgi:hypothetical protein
LNHGLGASAIVAESATLLSPKLHTLVLSYSGSEVLPERVEDFQKDEAQWLQKFVDHAVAKRSMLASIEILFGPDILDFGISSRDTECVYPWDLMDKIRDAIEPHGIVLSYAKPSISRQDFLKWL